MPKLAPLRHQGNESLFMAVEMSLISTLAGVPLHIHAEGLRGTGKTTVMRWAKAMVPQISQYKDCSYHCDPARPHCPIHRDLQRQSDSPDTSLLENIPMPFVEIGHGAKLGTILGSVDLERLTDPKKPEASLLPGAIPMANRGIIFIDEVNRLAETAPEITDVLLSVMGTKPGRVKIEEVGLQASEIEVTASVWAASNPDEDPGPLEDIRRQLADRFDLVVPIQRPQDPAIVERLLLRNAEPDSAGETFLKDIAEKAQRLGKVTVPRAILRYMAQLYVHRNVESLRAIEALELSSRLHAAMAGKVEVTFDELLVVIPLVLRHRVEPLTLSEILKDLELRRAAGTQSKTEPEPPPPPEDTVAREPAAGPGRSISDLASQVPNRSSQSREGEDGAAQAKNETPSSVDAPFGPKQGWLQQALSRYRESLRRLTQQPGDGRKHGGGLSQNLGTEHGERPPARQYTPVPNPKDVVPVSPPDRARRLSAMSWEELVNPPEWKDATP